MGEGHLNISQVLYFETPKEIVAEFNIRIDTEIVSLNGLFGYINNRLNEKFHNILHPKHPKIFNSEVIEDFSRFAQDLSYEIGIIINTKYGLERSKKLTLDFDLKYTPNSENMAEAWSVDYKILEE